MVKKQINVIIMTSDLYTVFFSDKSKALANFEYEILQILQDGFLQIVF